MSQTLEQADELATIYKAASEPIRLRILALLSHGELCVCQLHGVLDAPQPTVSRHLAILRQARLVRTRRDGSWVHYSLTDVAETWLAPALAHWRADQLLKTECCTLRGCP
jgi:ArsR family transcriptional regulator